MSNIGVAGGGAEGALALPGKISYLGRTKMGSWQDRNESLAGQKWEDGKTCNTSHSATFSIIFVSVLPFLVGFFPCEENVYP